MIARSAHKQRSIPSNDEHYTGHDHTHT